MRDTPLVTVVVPLHNHAEFVGQAISSVAAQSYGHLELIVIDDGSTDDSVAVAGEALRHCGLERTTLKVQPNLGAAATIDRGTMLASGEYIAILNSDDWFHHQRIETLLDHRDPTAEHCFIFSGLEFFCSAKGQPIAHDAGDRRFDWYGDAMALARWTPSAGFGLLCGSLTVTSSNFFFNRGLFAALRGFDNRLRLAHDWDFALRATYFTEPIFVHNALLSYRLHARNTSSTLETVHYSEGIAALERYVRLFVEPSPNPLAPEPSNWPRFFEFFAREVAPWFSSEPLATHLAFIPFVGPAASREPLRRIGSLDQEALAEFANGLEERRIGRRFDPTATRAAATRWNMNRNLT